MSMNLSDDEWKAKLTPEQYQVLRDKATEAPFSGALLHNDKGGDYTCGACGVPLFKSDTKFDSGSGWPSFNDAVEGAVTQVEDSSLGMARTEVTCTNCGSHLGHLFHDAYDQPTGERFCINSASLGFEEKPAEKS